LRFRAPLLARVGVAAVWRGTRGTGTPLCMRARPGSIGSGRPSVVELVSVRVTLSREPRGVDRVGDPTQKWKLLAGIRRTELGRRAMSARPKPSGCGGSECWREYPRRSVWNSAAARATGDQKLSIGPESRLIDAP